jgi:hypothetical protein
MREYREDMVQLFWFSVFSIKEATVHHMFNYLFDMLNLSLLVCLIMPHISTFNVKMNQKFIIVV